MITITSATKIILQEIGRQWIKLVSEVLFTVEGDI
jgi:hypothetical protein